MKKGSRLYITNLLCSFQIRKDPMSDIGTLNKEQKEFFYHVLHAIKTSDEPFYFFLSGGAGVGKSHVTKSLYQAAIKYYNTRAGDDFHQIKVIMLVPTGKVAYIIKGNTIHSTLAIPACQSLRTYFKGQT